MRTPQSLLFGAAVRALHAAVSLQSSTRGHQIPANEDRHRAISAASCDGNAHDADKLRLHSSSGSPAASSVDFINKQYGSAFLRNTHISF